MTEKSEQSSGENVDVLADVIGRLDNEIDGDRAAVGEIIDAFDDRSFGALYTVIGLIAAAPIIGAIPGMSVITGSLIFLIAIQHVGGRNHPWVPNALRDRSVSADKLQEATNKILPYAKRVDRHVRPRFGLLIAGKWQRRFAAALICILALTMIPLAVVPWGVQPPATAILMFGIAMMGRDGLFALTAYILVGLTAYLVYYFHDTLASSLSYLTGG